MHRWTIVLVLILASALISYAGIKASSSSGKTSVAPTSAQWDALAQLERQANVTAVAWNEENGTPAFLAGRLTLPGYRSGFGLASEAALKFLGDNHELFGLKSPAAELAVAASISDNIGMTHVKFDQMYQGIQVRAAQLIVHFAADGSISSVNGRYAPTPTLPTTPAIAAAAAAQTASAACSGSPATSTGLVIYLDGNTLKLAYRVKVATQAAPLQEVIVDASDGSVLETDSGIRYDGPVTSSGVALDGSTKTIHAYQGTGLFGLSGTQYFMIDATKPMFVSPVDSLRGVIIVYDAKNDTSNPMNPYAEATMVYDPNADNNFNDNQSLRAAVDAHYYTGIIYDYYKSRFNRNSWDDLGGTLLNVVHFLYHYNNAFWNGSFMSYGDGDGVEFSSLAGALDVTTHELTHGVTQATANLEYRGQSGALNESYSDVMATMLDSANWLIGEDVYTPGTPGDGLRSMADPHNGGSSLADAGWQPARMSEYIYLPYSSGFDNGGVHINSGIPNHAAYFVATQIGRGKTEQIYYRTLAYYLTPKSIFIDARDATLQAAADLYGGGGAEVNVVAAAFDSVGITSNLPRTDELAYDDGSPSGGAYETDAHWGIVNQFTTPGGGGSLAMLSFYFQGENNGSGNGSFVLKVFADNGGSPGSLIYSGPTLKPTNLQYKGWIPVGLQNDHISVGSAFYAGIFYDGVNEPMIGIDQVSNGHAWEWDSTQSSWVHLDQNSYFPVTVFIRAIVSTATGVGEAKSGKPQEFALEQNYPNPFNPVTTIRYALPTRAFTRLTVYDILGKEIATLVDGLEEPGYKSVQWNADGAASGVYFYRLQAGNFVSVKRFLLIR